MTMTKETFDEVFKYVVKYLRLEERDFDYNFEGEGSSNIDYTIEYLEADISYDKEILTRDFFDIVRVIVHEFCHIYTGAKAKEIAKNMNTGLEFIVGLNQRNDIQNSGHTISEMYTTKLERVFTSQLIDTKRYEKLKKSCNHKPFS